MTQIPMHTLGTLRVPPGLFTDGMLMGGGRKMGGEGKEVGGKGVEGKGVGRKGEREPQPHLSFSHAPLCRRHFHARVKPR